jgi:DNA-binding LytR/AlgR family response regulator
VWGCPLVQVWLQTRQEGKKKHIRAKWNHSKEGRHDLQNSQNDLQTETQKRTERTQETELTGLTELTEIERTETIESQHELTEIEQTEKIGSQHELTELTKQTEPTGFEQLAKKRGTDQTRPSPHCQLPG